MNWGFAANMFSEHVFWSCCSIPHVLEVLSAHCSDVVRRHRPLATTVYSMFPLALTTSGTIWWSFRPRLAKPGRAEHSNLQRCDTIFHNPILFLAYHLHRWKWHHCGVRYFLDLAEQLSCRKSCYRQCSWPFHHEGMMVNQPFIFPTTVLTS